MAFVNNPTVQNVLNLVRASGMTPQQYAQMLAQQKGVDLNDLIQQLQS